MTTRAKPQTDATLARLPRPKKEQLLAVGRAGLYLKRRPNGRDSWQLRTRVGGTWRVALLGEFPAMTLAVAAAHAEAAKPMSGTALDSATVGGALGEFFRTYVATRYRTATARRESESLLRRATEPLAVRLLRSVKRGEWVHCIDPLRDRPNSARKALALLRQFSGWCAVRGLLDFDPLAGVTGGRLGLEQYAPRERVLTTDELRTLCARADPDAHMLRFALLTACRIGEALAWTPAQVTGDVWTIPETKSGRPHTVPLSPAAAALLPLPSPRPVYVSMVGRQKRLGVMWNAHDLRRTAATLMREAGVAVSTVEAVLNHAPTRLVQVYQKHDPIEEKRAALHALAARLATVCI